MALIGCNLSLRVRTVSMPRKTFPKKLETALVSTFKTLYFLWISEQERAPRLMFSRGYALNVQYEHAFLSPNSRCSQKACQDTSRVLVLCEQCNTGRRGKRMRQQGYSYTVVRWCDSKPIRSDRRNVNVNPKQRWTKRKRNEHGEKSWMLQFQ